LFCRI
jgi:hypothetical protein